MEAVKKRRHRPTKANKEDIEKEIENSIHHEDVEVVIQETEEFKAEDHKTTNEKVSIMSLVEGDDAVSTKEKVDIPLVKKEITDDLQQYIDEQIEKNPEAITMLKLLTTHYVEELPTFEEIMDLKRLYSDADIHIVELGTNEEKIDLGLLDSFYVFVVRTMKFPEYDSYLQQFGEFKNDISNFYHYVINNLILYPQITDENLNKIDSGVIDQLSKIILQNSKFNLSYKMKRI